MTSIIQILKRFYLILFLLLFQNSLNESKDSDLNSDQSNSTSKNYSKNFLQPTNPNYSRLINKTGKRLNDLKQNERNQICSSNFKNTKCTNLPPECLECKFNFTCIYGTEVETMCKVPNNQSCDGSTEFSKTYVCSYCYQLPESNYTCNKISTCKPYSRYLTNCLVDKKVLCLGNRKFNKFIKCKPKSTVKWNYALIFSITLGGFGMDRFYLGNWQEAFGKLFSFGGLGFWTLIDVILIWVGYLKPIDGNYS